MNPNQFARNKNPLLSCAVTGGFEEFTGSGFVLTAAEKPVFTIGTPAISDTDNFSDVSLDRDGTNDLANVPLEAPGYYSPLAELDSMGNLQNIQSAPTLDLNQDHQQHIDANLNPISAALAQLPNAASTVFSTFSSIIKGSSSHPKMDEHQQQMSAPTFMEPSHQDSLMNPSGFMMNSSFDPNAPPPSFFSPTDDSLFKKQSVEPTLNNTFRLGGHKKKTYAHIPGLSANQQQMQSQAQSFNSNPVLPTMPPMPPQPDPPVNHFPEPQVHHFQDNQTPQMMSSFGNQPKEPEKTSKFSLTSLLPSQLIETATKNFFGSSEPSSNYDSQQNNYNEDFSVMTSAYSQPPQTANFFDGQQPQTVAYLGGPQSEQQQNPIQSALPPVSFFSPQQFNTSPFNQPIVSEQNVRKLSVGAKGETPLQPPTAMAPPPQVSAYNQTSFSPSPFTNAFNQSTANEPPKVETFSADSHCPPPTFFDPVQATEMFKPSQGDDGKTKNPYSNRLSRGVGMYKPRVLSESSNIQPVMMPPMPETTNPVYPMSSQFQQPQNQFISPPSSVATPMMSPMSNTSSSSSQNPALNAMFDQQKVPSRPGSIPPMPDSTSFFNPMQQQYTVGQQPQMFVPPPSNSAMMPPLPDTSNFGNQQPPMFDQQKIPSRPPSIPPAVQPVSDASSFFNPNQQFAAASQPPMIPQIPNVQSSSLPPPMNRPTAFPITSETMPEAQKIPSRPPSVPSSTMQDPISFMNAGQPQFTTATEPQKASSRPPSIPPLPAGNYGLPNQHEPSITSNAGSMVQTNLAQQFPPPTSFFFDPSRSFDQSVVSQESVLSTPPVQKKSDLNVPEPEIVTSTPSNFFQSQPVASQFENLPPTNSTPNGTSFNFFKTVASESEFSHRDNLSTMSNYFSNDYDTAVTAVCTAKDASSPFDASFANQSLQAPTNDTTTDISDKLDSLSMSENIGSTLSLFATSELDASLVHKIPTTFDSMIPKFLDTQEDAAILPAPSKNYRPVYRHWFYQNLYWHPFAMSDSLALDDALLSGREIIVTDGGRFEVDLKEGRRSSIYWLSGTNMIRRCSWFFKNPNGSETNLIPFEESVASFLEKEYEKAIMGNEWNKQIMMPNGDEYVVFVDALNLEYYQMGQVLIVKRGVDEFVIDDGEEAPVDHLIISVSGFGDKIGDSADELRSKCMETVHHYYSDAFDCGQVGRLEVLPISLNSVDVLKMKETNATIEAAPGGNAELMKSSTYQDIIMKTAFYCNQEFYQNIMTHLAFSLNEIVTKFLQRNSEFKGEFSLIATSFEALFLFDLLLNQETASDFWKLKFNAANFYAFGMPSNLLTIRNGAKLQMNFEMKNCKKFLNVVHRLDPIAQRIEPLIKPEFTKLAPESIESEVLNRTDFTIADGSSLESFSLKNYFTSELIILRITNEIYGALKMDSGSL